MQSQGLLFGAGIGIAYSAPIVCGWRWFPRRKGVVVGCVVAGFGAGAAIFDQFQTKFVNPDGLSCQYGCPDEVTDRVPSLMRTLGVIYACMQLVGCMFLRNPPKTYSGGSEADGM